MGKPINNFKLGLFTLGGLALLVAGLLAFGARGYFQASSTYETYIEGDVTGLTDGSAVELRGVNVGKVTRIDFSWTEYQVTQPSYIVVQFVMRDDIKPTLPGATRESLLEAAIQRGLRARIKAKGITGTSVLSLEYVDPAENPPAQFPWKPNYPYIPSAPGDFVELLAAVQKVLRNLQGFDFTALNQHAQYDLKSAGNLLDKVGQFDFGSLSTNANVLLSEVRDSNSKLKSLLQDTDNTITRAQLEKLTRDLDTLANQLQDTVARLEPGVANIDFDALNQTLSNARQTIRDLDDTLSQLKQYPSGFLFGKPPIPVKGVDASGKK
ncbi:MAG TPA: MlaD family protein [Verrucomicrobiae bacterium]|nr:MlaD family protein [Verrucomicrobiae bacterium]